jgi:ferredoxin
MAKLMGHQPRLEADMLLFACCNQEGSVPRDRLHLQPNPDTPSFGEVALPVGERMRVYKRLPVVRKTRCVACGLCGSVCPFGCLEVRGEFGVLIQDHACTSEGDCVSACPNGAIQMKWVRLRGDHSLQQTPCGPLRALRQSSRRTLRLAGSSARESTALSGSASDSPQYWPRISVKFLSRTRRPVRHRRAQRRWRTGSGSYRHRRQDAFGRR